MPTKNRLKLDSPARYMIRIQGTLNDSWKEYLNAITIEVQSQFDEPPVTVAICEFVDQAELASSLSYLYSMGLPLLAVECIGFEPDNLP